MDPIPAVMEQNLESFIGFFGILSFSKPSQKLEQAEIMIAEDGKEPGFFEKEKTPRAIRATIGQISRGEDPIHGGIKLSLVEDALQVEKTPVKVPNNEVSSSFVKVMATDEFHEDGGVKYSRLVICSRIFITVRKAC
jgi:hypothetical protein